MTRVFVYGTLMRGEPNHRLLEGAEFVGEAHTAECFTMYDLGAFPGVVAQPSEQVRGQVYAVDDETLEQLDRLEGHPRFYQRQEVEVYVYWVRGDVFGAVLHSAQMYVLPEAFAHQRGTNEIPHADWRRFQEERSQ